jgi:succinate-semialdehyde dehydrogenase/glutarate-semialdehyde dehydrogenase
MYPNTQLFIDGAWSSAASGKTLAVLNPATGEAIGNVAHAGKADLDRALAAAEKGFQAWRKISPYERSKILRKAAQLMRERADDTAKLMTAEQGKPVAQAKMEAMLAGDIIEWFAEEGRRAYGRVIPARGDNIYQLALKEPVGPVAAFTPWNFPINQIVRKASAALAAGCSIIAKGPEETPASCAALIRCYADAGVPAGVVSLVYGVPAEISEYLIPHPVIRKISFTGSTAVGKHLAMIAGKHMKRVTMELGGHAPAIVFSDADVDQAVNILSQNKYRNAGQVCIAPTRFLVQKPIYDQFLTKFVAAAKATKVGDGMETGVAMGPLANARRVDAMEGFIADAQQHGGTVETGGKRIGNKGFFFEPTVMTSVPKTARMMNEEPFGPVAMIAPFTEMEEAVQEANRLPYGLAAYAYTRSAKTASAVGAQVESGMISINHHGLALPEVPFGGVKDSGYGSEGGSEALEAYLNTKFVSQLGV